MTIEMNSFQVNKEQLEAIKTNFDCYVNPAIKHEVILDTTNIEEDEIINIFGKEQWDNGVIPDGMVLFYYA